MHTKKETIEIMDTTLRDGEQAEGISFNSEEKLAITKVLLKETKVSRIEIASARVSQGEEKSVKKIAAWAKANQALHQIEVLGFVDGKISVDWIKDCGCQVINLLAKGSEKHCLKQLGKKPTEHFKDVEETVDYARKRGLKVNVYLEDWSQGIQDSQDYVMAFVQLLKKLKIERIMLPDTLGVFSPSETEKFIKIMVKNFPDLRFDFHGHNDYGLATANSLAAIGAGVKGIHTTVNSLGERTGNASLVEVVVGINDQTDFHCTVDEKKLMKISKMVSVFSGRRISENQPVVGENVFTQTAGIHADGDMKAKLYETKLSPERFKRVRKYALGKLSGRASVEINLKKLGINLDVEQKKKLLEEIIKLGDRGKKVASEDLPFLIRDILEVPEHNKVAINDCTGIFQKDKPSKTSLILTIKGKKFKEEAEGDGNYDAFMNTLKKIAKKTNISLPVLVDYNIKIPPGGKTDAIVETTIIWKKNGELFITTGVDSDQFMAAVKATEKMLNLIV